MLPFPSPPLAQNVRTLLGVALPQEENAASRIAPRPSSFISPGLNNRRGGRKVREIHEGGRNQRGGRRSVGRRMHCHSAAILPRTIARIRRTEMACLVGLGRPYPRPRPLPYMCCVTVVPSSTIDCLQEMMNRLHWTVRPIQPVIPFPVVILWPNRVEFDLPQLCKLSYCVIDDDSIGHISQELKLTLKL